MAWAGILGLVFLRFPGAGSPRSLRGVMGERPLREGPPRAAAPAAESHYGGRKREGSGPSRPPRRLPPGWGGAGGKGRGPGYPRGLGARAGRELGTWAGVAGELRTFPPPPCRGGSSGLLCWR